MATVPPGRAACAHISPRPSVYITDSGTLFGSLVSILDDRQSDGFLAGKGMLVEENIARLMYRSFYKMHETALHGPWKVGLIPSPDR